MVGHSFQPNHAMFRSHKLCLGRFWGGGENEKCFEQKFYLRYHEGYGLKYQYTVVSVLP